MDKIKKLIESPNRGDVLLGFEMLYREKGDKYFRDQLTKGNPNDPGGTCSEYIHEFKIHPNTTSLLIKLPGRIVIHCLSNSLLYHEYKTEYDKMIPPKYGFFDVHEIQEL